MRDFYIFWLCLHFKWRIDKFSSISGSTKLLFLPQGAEYQVTSLKYFTQASTGAVIKLKNIFQHPPPGIFFSIYPWHFPFFFSQIFLLLHFSSRLNMFSMVGYSVNCYQANISVYSLHVQAKSKLLYTNHYHPLNHVTCSELRRMPIPPPT